VSHSKQESLWVNRTTMISEVSNFAW